MDNIHAMGTRSGKPLISADIRTSFLIWSCLLLLLGQSFQGHAQIFPVQSSTQLVPPYSVYLSDYATPGNEKLRVILVQRDLTQPSYQLRLLMQVEWNGKVIMRTSRAYNPAPISLDPGVPTIISGAELFPYLDSRNIDFVGYSREQYERTKALPEGSYRISFTAYDYRRQDVQVSNEGSSFYYLSKNEPPLINMPVCGAKVPVRQPQQVIFSWLPRNTSSPASASETQYEFSLYEIRPEGRNPNDVVLSSQPVFKTTIDYTQLVYGPAEPQLIENMRYAWRVRAIDTQGRDAFRNNGYSEVCTFTYGGVDPAFIVGGIEGLQAEGESERSARIWWEKGSFDSYRIYYKKSGQGHEWFTSDLLAQDLGPAKEEGELKLFDLEPDTEYETRAQAKKMGTPGPYTDIIKFRTLPVRVAHCGDPALLPEGGPGEPFREAIKGMTIDVDGMEMTLLDVVHLGDGYYQGLGRVSVDYLGGAAFTASFDRIFINTDRQVVLGRIDFVTNGVAVMAEEQLAAQKKREGEREAEDLAVNGNGNEGKDIIFEGVIDSVYMDEKGEIIIIDTEGERFVYGQPVDPATGVVLPVNIVDGGGNGYVVDKEGNVSQGGTNSGIEDVVSDTEAGKDKGYYIMAGTDTTKYKYGDELVYIKHKSKVKLTVGSEKDTLKVADLKWEIDGKEVCKGKAECEADLSKDGNYKIELFAGADKVLKLNLDVYKKPVVKFERGSGYNGEYGFDDAQQSKLQQAGDYNAHKLKISGTDYYTPWLTFRNGQTIMLGYKVEGLEKQAQKDKEFEITFKSSSANVTIDGAQEIKLNYNTANSKNNLMFIEASKGSSSFSSPVIITATDHKGVEIGKLVVVHGNVEPAQQYDVVFVKVKHNKNYPAFNESNATFKLSQESYNQFFRSWSNITTSSDTLDISSYYKANKSDFSTSTDARNKIADLYMQQTSTDIKVAGKGKTYFVFITDISISKTDQNGNPGKVAGIAGGIGRTWYCVLFNDRSSSTVVHELGHVLGFEHTFSKNLNQRQIPEKTTESYMDYSTTRNMFFLYQMKKIK